MSIKNDDLILANGGLAPPYKTISANYTLNTSDGTLNVDTSGVVVTLPLLATITASNKFNIKPR